jgi:hypothetical protein
LCMVRRFFCGRKTNVSMAVMPEGVMALLRACCGYLLRHRSQEKILDSLVLASVSLVAILVFQNLSFFFQVFS